MNTIDCQMETVTCRKWDYGTIVKAIEIVKQEADKFGSDTNVGSNGCEVSNEENNIHQTNADRIRSFSDEELSKFIGKFLEAMSDCENCPAKTEAFLCVDCADEILDWLRKEVEE